MSAAFRTSARALQRWHANGWLEPRPRGQPATEGISAAEAVEVSKKTADDEKAPETAAVSEDETAAKLLAETALWCDCTVGTAAAYSH